MLISERTGVKGRRGWEVRGLRVSRAGQDVGIDSDRFCREGLRPSGLALPERGRRIRYCGGCLLGRPNQAAAQDAAEESVSCRGWATVGGLPGLGRWACGLWGGGAPSPVERRPGSRPATFRSSWASQFVGASSSDPSHRGSPWALGVPSRAEEVRPNVHETAEYFRTGEPRLGEVMAGGRDSGAVRLGTQCGIHTQG